MRPFRSVGEFMCGLAGFIETSRTLSAAELTALAQRMSATLHHRGPDDNGTWCDAECGIALGFQRLSIVDLSAAGHQPMVSPSGRFVIVYNGEVYNHNELRSELVAAGHPFRGHSDTEVLIAGFAEWGIESTVQRCLGMFAFAVWDTVKRELTLGRDRLGKKPLYLWHHGTTLIFGSETKALRAHPAFKPEICRPAISDFLEHGYLTGTRSIYRDVVSVAPGTLTTIGLSDEKFWSGQSPPSAQPYWRFEDAVQSGLKT